MAENLREIKTDLAAAFPSVRFTYDTAGRGRSKGPRISWTGGPDTTAVNQAAGRLWHKRGSVTLHFNRTPTPEELAAIAARQAQEHAEWLADAPDREARHKATIAERRRLGAAKAAVTRARKAEEAAWTLNRTESDQCQHQREALQRPARKQAKRAEKAARVRKAIARYPLAMADAGCRRNRLSAQIALPIELPRRRAA